MKTLYEVIDAMERCKRDKCYECPYHEKIHKDSCIAKREDDALHYLKAFRDAKDTLEREKDRYAEAVKNCERAENIYKQKQKAAEDALWICKEDKKDELTALRAYWAEQHENNALTWAELKQMEGKPVWVEALLYKQWAIIAYVGVDHIRFEGVNLYAPECRVYMGADNGWQAYRKERG